MNAVPIFRLGSPNSPLTNPLANTISEAEQILSQIEVASEELENAIVDERTWFSRHKEAESTYEMAENEIVSEAVMNAKLGEGPLAGIAATSKDRDIILTKIKNDARKGPLARQWASFTNVRKSYEAAQIDLQRAEARMRALLRISELKNGILRASTVWAST